MTQLEHKLSARDIRERVGHPLVDGDGHLIEVKEAFVRFVRSRGREHLLEDPGARGLLVPGRSRSGSPPRSVVGSCTCTSRIVGSPRPGPRTTRR